MYDLSRLRGGDRKEQPVKSELASCKWTELEMSTVEAWPEAPDDMDLICEWPSKFPGWLFEYRQDFDGNRLVFLRDLYGRAARAWQLPALEIGWLDRKRIHPDA